jgi:hypothetical protein
VHSIRARRFEPDRDRSGRWASEVQRDSSEAPLASADPEAELSATGSVQAEGDKGQSSDSSGSEERDASSGPEGFECALEALGVGEALHRGSAKGVPKRADRGNLWSHRTRMTFHCGRNDDDAHFACGREISEAYVKCPGVEILWPRCTDCFGKDS